MLKINQKTTFDEVHQWISNYFNNTCAGADEEKGTIGAINDPDEEQYEEWNEETEGYYDDYNDEDVKYVVAMLNKGKGKRRQKGGKNKGKDKGGKDNKGVTCYTCGKSGHISPNCPNKALHNWMTSHPQRNYDWRTTRTKKKND
eukprot:3280522-Amphidinium_carterae.1